MLPSQRHSNVNASYNSFPMFYLEKKKCNGHRVVQFLGPCPVPAEGSGTPERGHLCAELRAALWVLGSRAQLVPLLHGPLRGGVVQPHFFSRKGAKSPQSKASMAWGWGRSLGFLKLSFSVRRARSTSTGSFLPVNFCTASSLQGQWLHWD